MTLDVTTTAADERGEHVISPVRLLSTSSVHELSAVAARATGKFAFVGLVSRVKKHVVAE